MVNPERALALTEAVKLHAESFGDVQAEESRRAVLVTARDFYGFLTGPASVVIAFGPIVKQNTLEPTGKAGTAMTQMHDDEEFDIDLTDVFDAKGAAVPDQPGTEDDPTFTSDDEAVFTYRHSSDNPRSVTVVGGLPGSATGTIQLGSVVVTHAVDIVAGGVATVSLTEGPVRKQA